MAAPIVYEYSPIARSNYRMTVTGNNFNDQTTVSFRCLIFRDYRIVGGSSFLTSANQKLVIADYIGNGLSAVSWTTAGIDVTTQKYNNNFLSVSVPTIEGSSGGVNIQSITNPSAARYVVTTSSGHGFTTGQGIGIYNVTGHLGPTDPNGNWIVEVINSTSFYINRYDGTTVTGNGSSGSGAVGVAQRGIAQCFLFSLKNSDGTSSTQIVNKPKLWSIAGQDPSRLFTKQSYSVMGDNIFSLTWGTSVWLYDHVNYTSTNPAAADFIGKGLWSCSVWNMRGGDNTSDYVYNRRSFIDFEIAPILISTVTNPSGLPYEVTTSSNHNLTTGQQVSLSSVVNHAGSPNGTWTITVTSATKFTLDTSVGTGGASGSLGFVSPVPGNYKLLVFTNENLWSISNLLDVTILDDSEESWYSENGSTYGVVYKDLKPSFKITSISNPSGNPYVVNHPGHSIVDGDEITIFLSTGHGGTTPNNTWIATYIDDDNFSLNGSSGNGGATSSNGYYEINRNLHPLADVIVDSYIQIACFRYQSTATANKPIVLRLPVGTWQIRHTLVIPDNMSIQGSGNSCVLRPYYIFNKTKDSSIGYNFATDIENWNSDYEGYHAASLAGIYADTQLLSGKSCMLRIKGDNARISDITLDHSYDNSKYITQYIVGCDTIDNIEFKNVDFYNYNDLEDSGVVLRQGICNNWRFVKCNFVSRKCIVGATADYKTTSYATNGAINNLLVEHCNWFGLGAISNSYFCSLGYNALITNNYFYGASRVFVSTPESYSKNNIFSANQFSDIGNGLTSSNCISYESTENEIITITTPTSSTFVVADDKSHERWQVVVTGTSGIGQQRTIISSTVKTLSISSVSNPSGTPIVVTTSGSHTLTTGDGVKISGVTGHALSVNANWVATVTGATTFTIGLNGNNGSTGSSGTVSNVTDTLEEVWNVTPAANTQAVIAPMPTNIAIILNIFTKCENALFVDGSSFFTNLTQNWFRNIFKNIILFNTQHLSTKLGITGFVHLDRCDLQYTSGLRFQATRGTSETSTYVFPIMFGFGIRQTYNKPDMVNVISAGIYDGSGFADENDSDLTANPPIISVGIRNDTIDTDYNKYGQGTGYVSKVKLRRIPWLVSDKGVGLFQYDSVVVDGVSTIPSGDLPKFYEAKSTYRLLSDVLTTEEFAYDEVHYITNAVNDSIDELNDISGILENAKEKFDTLVIEDNKVLASLNENESFVLTISESEKIDEIKDQTDNLSISGGNVLFTLDNEDVNLSTAQNSKLDAILSKTNKLSDDSGDIVASLDNENVVLSTNALDDISIADPSGPADDFVGMVVQLWRWLFKKKKNDGSTIKTYADDGFTVITTQSILDVGDIQEIDDAS